METLLIRHGDPDYANDTLTTRGHAEARALAQSLRDVQIDYVYVSPMGRANDTMRYTAEVQGLSAITLPWLRELDGNFEGARWAWNVPGAKVLKGPDLPGMEAWPQSVVYGEHMRPQHEELARNFDALLREHGYEKEGHRYRVLSGSEARVAFFCHAGVILSLLSHLLHWPLPLVYSHLAYDPTGVSRLRWQQYGDHAVPKAAAINDLSHLRAAGL